MFIRSFVATLLALAAFPAQSGETAWVEVMPHVTMRLVSSDALSNEGRMWMGLEIAMPSDTKTYWRVPGEAGVPLTIDSAASSGVGPVEIAWPYPLRETEDGYVDHVYYGHVLIPFSVEVVSGAARFDADVSLGVCSDVCVPANARFYLTLNPDAPDSANTLRIEQALARVPLSADERVMGAAVFDTARQAVIAQNFSPDIDPALVIASVENSMMVFDAPVREGEDLVFPLLGRIDPASLEEAVATFTYETADGPFVAERVLQ